MTTKYTNITIDNVNPAIVYSPWTEWSEGADHWCSSGTFTTTSTPGATATFSFFGSSIWIIGGKGSTYGTHSATFDNGTPHTGLQDFRTETLYNQTLFYAIGEANAFHTVVLNNTGSVEGQTDFNIDSIVYQVGTPGDEAISSQQDNDPAFSYSGTWSTNPDNLSSYSGGTGHSTSDKAGFVKFKFQGASVQIFGTVGPQNGGYSVQIDDGPPTSYNATKSKFYPQVLLYQTGGLTGESHIVTLTNQPYTDGQQLNIDFANSANPPSSSSNPPEPSSGSGSSSGNGLGSGAIGGIVAGVLILALIGALFLYFDRRRRRDRELIDLTNEHPESDPIYTGISSEPDFSPYRAYSYTQLNHDQVSQNPANLMGTSPTYDTTPRQPATQQMYQLPSDTSPMQTPGSTTSFHSGSNGTSSSGQNRSNAKAPRPLPDTALLPAPIMSPSDLSRIRRTEEGRPQDFGPVLPSSSDLPPSYNQATEPFPPAS